MKIYQPPFLRQHVPRGRAQENHQAGLPSLDSKLHNLVYNGFEGVLLSIICVYISHVIIK